MNIGKLFIVLGVVSIIVGLLWTFIGKLPGDIHVKRGNVSFYFPIMTSIVVSVIISIIFLISSKFR